MTLDVFCPVPVHALRSPVLRAGPCRIHTAILTVTPWVRPLFSRSGSEAPLRPLRTEGATPRLPVDVVRRTNQPAGLKSHDDIIERVLLRPVSGALAVSPPGRATESVPPLIGSRRKMATGEQESWSRVKERLRTEVGEDVYSSWFARMDLEGLETGTVRLSVPTRFLKSWIQSHYAERLLACWQAEHTEINRIELNVRSAVVRSAVTKPKELDGLNGHHVNGFQSRPIT